MLSTCEQIQERRNCGRTLCAHYHGHEVLPRSDRLRDLGYEDIPEHLWVVVQRGEALELLTDCLSRDLAYQAEIMTPSTARELAAAFLRSFAADTRFLTNTRKFSEGVDDHSRTCWEPISAATFDTGVIAEAGGVVGILWVEDED